MKQYKKLKKLERVISNKIKNEFTSGASISSGFIDYTEEQLKFFKKSKQTDKHMKLTNTETINPSRYNQR